MAITFVANSAGALGSASSNILAIALGGTIGAGNTFVVFVQYTSASNNLVTSVTDGGSLYARVGSTLVSSGSNKVEIWACTVAGSVANVSTVTVNLSSSLLVSGCAAAYAGVGSIGSTTAAGNTTNSPNPSVSLTITKNNDWVVAGFSTLGVTAGTFAQSIGTHRVLSAHSGATPISALADNTAGSGSVTVAEVLSASTTWGAGIVELIASGYPNSLMMGGSGI